MLLLLTTASFAADTRRICHQTGSGTVSMMEVPWSAVDGHVGHGDTLAAYGFLDADGDGWGAGAGYWSCDGEVVNNDNDCDDTDPDAGLVCCPCFNNSVLQSHFADLNVACDFPAGVTEGSCWDDDQWTWSVGRLAYVSLDTEENLGTCVLRNAEDEAGDDVPRTVAVVYDLGELETDYCLSVLRGFGESLP